MVSFFISTSLKLPFTISFFFTQKFLIFKELIRTTQEQQESLYSQFTNFLFLDPLFLLSFFFPLMDSLDTPPPPLSAPSNMAIGGQTAYSPANNNASSTIALNQPSAQMIPPSSRFPFNHPVIPPSSVPLDSLNVSPYDGSHSANFNVDSGKKRRGRPRKYAPDANNIALGLAPTPTVGSSVPHGDLSATPDSEQPARKTRGRPPGSGKKQSNSIGIVN